MIENPLIRTGPDQFSWAAKDQANQSRADFASRLFTSTSSCLFFLSPLLIRLNRL